MLTRFFLIIIALISLGWIIFTSYEMLSGENDYNPTYLFSKEDEEIIVINQAEDLTVVLQHCETTAENKELISLLDNTLNFQTTLSTKRNHVLINCQEMITPNYLKALFLNNSTLNTNGFNTFEINGYKGIYHKNKCYLSTIIFEKATPEFEDLKIDKNATASLINLRTGSGEVTDIYIKKGESIEFKRNVNGKKFGKKVSDEQVFGAIISSSITSYEFYETDYLRGSDKVFSNSPMNDWVKTGVVKVEIGGKQALITDYRDGQNPINVMCEALKIEPQNYESASFAPTSLLSDYGNKSTLFFYLMDDYIVISTDKATCEKMVGDFKLGNTILHNEAKRSRFYGDLPRKVNYRLVRENQKESSSVYANSLLTTKSIKGQKELSAKDETTNMKSVNIGEFISNFFTIDDKRIFVQSKSNKFAFIENNVKKWEKELEGKVIGTPELIDIYTNGNSQLLVTTSKKVYVLDVNGNFPAGFPLEVNENCATPSIFYTWKGKSNLLAPLENGQIAQYDTKGSRLALIKSNLKSFALKPIVWVSSNKPFLGIYDGTTFEMIELEKKRSFRKFNASGITDFFKLQGEILLLGNENGHLVQYNQKGQKSSFGNEEGLKLISINNDIKTPTLIAQSGKTIQLFNSRGEKWLSIPLNFDVIEGIQLKELENGQLLLTFINGIENNVYLYSSNGKRWKEKSWDGSLKAELFITQGNSFKILTVVDKMIVEYKETK